MQFEIMENTQPVSFDVPSVSFPAYEAYRERAEDISEQIRSMEVTPDNIREAKTTLAEARKIMDRLSRARIDIKKAILSNYETFESQVKEIAAIIGDADEALRIKVRELEEAERKAKKSLIEEVWAKRINGYPFIRDRIPAAFDRWFKPQHLNKSMTMKKVEADMVSWLEKTEQDFESAQAMGEQYLVEYALTGNLSQAIQNVKAREMMKVTVADTDPDEVEEVTALFLIRGAKDITFTEMLLNQNDIDYERK